MDTVVNHLKNLGAALGCAGETAIVEKTIALLKPFVDEIEIDALGNILAVRRADSPNAKTVLLEAHMDEIGFLVTGIDENGFVLVAPMGGVDKRVLATQSVMVYGKNAYHGVFCSTPPHLLKGEKTVPEITDMAIDVGLDEKTAKECIPLGSRVGFAPNFIQLSNDIVVSKSLDNRSGMAAILYCLQQLSDRNLNVTVSFSVQEELGCRGAAAAARKICPDYAIVTDVSFALTADSNARMCGKRGEGVMIGISPVLNASLSEQMQMLAEKFAIPHQIEVMADSTGTDADVISVSGHGIPSCLLSIPLRYMHTPVESVNVQDIKAVGDLMARWIEWKGARIDE